MISLTGTTLKRFVLAAVCGAALVRSASAQTPQSPQQLLQAMLVQEHNSHSDHYDYIANERSERTGGHMWTERVVETSVGRVRRLMAVDGKPLSPEQALVEQQRLETIASDPEDFARREAANKNDEAHARQMLDMLPKAFLFDNVRLEGGTWRMDFRPNPDFSTSGMEERVLHGMSGWVAIDAKDMRLIHIEGHLPQDVSIGFGILATIRAGSNFSSDRALIGGHWRTVHVVTDIRGKAALFKTVAKNSTITRSDFQYLSSEVAVPQAVALLVR